MCWFISPSHINAKQFDICVNCLRCHQLVLTFSTSQENLKFCMRTTKVRVFRLISIYIIRFLESIIQVSRIKRATTNSFAGWLTVAVAGPDGSRLKPPPHPTPPPPPFLNIPRKRNNLVSVRPKYFILMEFFFFKKNEIKSTKRIQTYEPPFQKSWIRAEIVCWLG